MNFKQGGEHRLFDPKQERELRIRAHRLSNPTVTIRRQQPCMTNVPAEVRSATTFTNSNN